jgi:hypothetical protein
MSASGYSITTDLTYRTIYIYPAAEPDPLPQTATMYPPATMLTVAVTDASGSPVAGVPVSFAVAQNSMLQGSVEFEPRSQTTDADGKVQVRVSPTGWASTGAGNILVRVENMTETVGLTIEKSKFRG